MKHLLARALTAFPLFAAGLGACTDSPTEASTVGRARLAVVPRFSEEAAAILRSLGSFALAVDNVHVTVRSLAGGGGVGAVLKDTTIAFPADADEIRVQIDVVLPARTQDLVAFVQLREATTVYFEGSANVVARQGATTSSSEPVAMAYVGPGASAASLRLGLLQPTIAPSSALQFTATAYDAADKVVSDLPITWSSSDASVVTISSSGLATSTGRIGSATITARGLNGVSVETTLSVQPVTRLAYIGGDNQVGIVGLLLEQPFIVEAFSASGDRVIGASIAFSAVTPGGSVTTPTATTDLAGRAGTTIRLGAAIGAYSFLAVATGLPNVPGVTIAATALSGPATAINIVSGTNQRALVGLNLATPLVVRVSDALGNPAAGVPVDWRVVRGMAVLFPDGIPDVAGVLELHSVTAADGTSRVLVQLGTLAGPVEIVASLPQNSAAPSTFSATALAGPVAQLVVVRQPAGTAQATIPLTTQPVVRLADSYGNGVSQSGVAIDVSARLSCGDIPCSDVTPRPVDGTTQQVTDADGIATFTDLALSLPIGAWQLWFAAASASIAAAPSTPIVLSAGPAASIIAEKDTIVAGPGATLTPRVRVLDAAGNGAPNVTLRWEAVGVVPAATTVTDADGWSSPTQWVLPATQALPFVITVTPEGVTVKNAPLRIYVTIL